MQYLIGESPFAVESMIADCRARFARINVCPNGEKVTFMCGGIVQCVEAEFNFCFLSYTETSFEENYRDFVDFASKACPQMLSYFDDNWKPCKDMWANYARGVYFSAGNTTANRIEANWNQLKKILGHRPRIDRTVAGLLSHQVTVFRQFASVLRRHSSKAQKSRMNGICCILS